MKTKKIIQLFFIYCSFFAITLHLCAQEKRSIKVGGDSNYPPYTYLDEKGEPTGYMIEAAKAIFETAGLDYKIELTSWSKALDDFDKNSIDAIIGMNYTEERATKYAFNFSLEHIYYDFIVPSNSSFTSEKELKGKHIIAQKNYTSAIYLRKTTFTKKIKTVTKLVEAFNLLKEGKADAFICNRRSAQYYINQNLEKDKYKILPSDLPPFEQAIATHLKDIDLLYKLDKAFFTLKEKGTFDKIYHRWFGEYIHVKHYTTLVYILLGILLLFVLTIAFTILLRHNVNIATAKLSHSEQSLIQANKKLDRKILELEKKDKHLQHAKEKAEYSDRLKSLFLANISHEIRTPLNAIVGFSELVTEEEDTITQKEYSKLITSNSDLLLSIISDILDLSKIESGIIDFEPQQFDFAIEFNELTEIFHHRIEKLGLKFIIHQPYKHCFIEGDKHRLSQVITNFVTNAIKFTREGYIEIGYMHKKDGLYLYVTDTGIGIPEEYIGNVFDRFYKVNRFSQGTGLGMSISKAIMESCNGRIGVKSEHGKGSTFWFFYPCDVEIRS